AQFIIPTISLPDALPIFLAPILTPSPLWALTSFNRYILASFPLFFVLGWALARSRLVLGAWLLASAGFGVYLTVLFVTWRWVARSEEHTSELQSPYDLVC